MKFTLTPKFDKQPWANLALPFDGSRQEAYERAKLFASSLVKLFHKPGFTVRIDRTDKPAAGYEVGADGHTIE